MPMLDDNLDQKALDLFGETLMKQVRDTQIQFWDELLAGKIKHRNYQPVYDRLRETLDPEQTASVRDVIPYVVDNVIAHTLGMLQSRRNEIKVAVYMDGLVVSDLYKASDGLEGELYTEDGWIARFSKERYDPIGLEKDR